MTAPTVRPERPEDVAAIRAVLAAAFGQPDEADLVDALRADPAWVLGLVAEQDGVITGHLAFTRLPVGAGDGLALAPLAVAPENQSAGVGTALVRSGLARARATGERVIVVLGDPGYYGRFGFVTASALGITGPFGDIPEFQALVLAEPAPRGQVAYPAPFGV